MRFLIRILDPVSTSLLGTSTHQYVAPCASRAPYRLSALCAQPFGTSWRLLASIPEALPPIEDAKPCLVVSWDELKVVLKKAKKGAYGCWELYGDGHTSPSKARKSRTGLPPAKARDRPGVSAHEFCVWWRAVLFGYFGRFSLPSRPVIRPTHRVPYLQARGDSLEDCAFSRARHNACFSPRSPATCLLTARPRP